MGPYASMLLTFHMINVRWDDGKATKQSDTATLPRDRKSHSSQRTWHSVPYLLPRPQQTHSRTMNQGTEQGMQPGPSRNDETALYTVLSCSAAGAHDLRLAWPAVPLLVQLCPL